MRLLAIDPGDVESALLVYDTKTSAPVWWEKLPNTEALALLANLPFEHSDLDMLAVEMIASYGMPVGQTTFETCLWVGRFIERWQFIGARPWLLVYRLDVKMHLCGNARANDANIRQALIDRYGPGRAAAVGRKATPGPLYGMSGDGWAALGVAVTAAETRLDGVEREAGAPGPQCAPIGGLVRSTDRPARSTDRPAVASFPLSTKPPVSGRPASWPSAPPEAA